MLSMTIHANIGAKAFRVGRKRVLFIPKGPRYRIGRLTRRQSADFAVTGEKQLVGRLFVGLNVGGKPRWTMREVVNAVLKIRHSQGRSAGATFVAQQGVYQPSPSAPVDQEKSVQIILMNLYDGLPERTFKSDMHNLAKALTRQLHQEQIIGEVQKGGRVIDEFVETAPTVFKVT